MITAGKAYLKALHGKYRMNKTESKCSLLHEMKMRCSIRAVNRREKNIVYQYSLDNA